jgi:hypothetical protein
MNTLRMEIEEMVAGRDGREAMTLSDVVEIVEVLADRLDTMKEEMAVTHTIINPADLSNTIEAVYDIGIDTGHDSSRSRGTARDPRGRSAGNWRRPDHRCRQRWCWSDI